MSDLEKNQDSDFMSERIKERPVNKKKLLRRTIITASMAVIFGLIACLTFLVLEPVFSNWLYPEEEPEIIELPDATDEMLPEDMLTEEEIQIEEETEVKLEEEQIEQILSGVQLDLEDYKEIYESLGSLAKEAEKSVATVTSVTSDVDWFNNTYENKGVTSGLVIADNGRELLILAEKKVIENGETILVTFWNGTQAEATVKQSDANTGLAVIAIPLSGIDRETRDNMVYANLGSSFSKSIVGSPVIAVGSPLGNSNSVCYGVVTSMGTPIHLNDANYYLMTTDIYGSINASGILINLQGQVIGILNNSYNSSDTENLVSAIGISDLKKVIEKLSNGQELSYLGVYGTDVTMEAQQQLGVPRGAYVTSIALDSPAMNYGIQSGDVITGFGEITIVSYTDLTNAILNTPPETTITLTVQRQSVGEYQPMELDVELGKPE
ncbi:MAG: PDZ domain-containing protein [Lachnospiraceae bacterium]|nr:PDZ domain-containing protein [Lachnospiraceae bacterium]